MSEVTQNQEPQEENLENDGTLATMPKEERAKLVSKYVQLFKNAERLREPTQKKNLRLHKLYRAYRDAKDDGTAYPYHTNIMPPIAFGIVETVKPRLSAGKMRLRVLPTNKADAGSDALGQWESLANNVITGNTQFMDEKVEWIHAMLNYGNGYMMIHWDQENKKPIYTSLDNWLLYIDPNAGPNLEGSRYEIRQIFKEKKTLKKSNELHGMYDHLDDIDGKNAVEDPRFDRERIETLKMGQIKGNGKTTDREEEKKQRENQVELLEIYDHLEGKLATIANRSELIRYENNPYANVNGGRIIVDLPCIKVPWSKEAMSIIEPVESNINEIADIRNHAMENIAYNMDPIRKVRKSAELTASDIETRPGALWQLANADDVVVDRPTPLSEDWMKAVEMLQGEIQGTLALSEYTSGNPHSSQEPADKVNALLKQSGIRFSQMVRQYEKSLTEVATIVRDMYQEFLPENLDYRNDYEDTGEFETFESADTNVELRIEVEPDQAKTPAERKDDLLQVYKLFIGEEEPGESDDEMARYKERKKLLQQMILEEYGQDQYAEIMATLEDRMEEEVEDATEEVDQELPQEPIAPGPIQAPQQVPLSPPPVQQAPPLPGPVDGPPQQPGMLQRLLGSLTGNR